MASELELVEVGVEFGFLFSAALRRLRPVPRRGGRHASVRTLSIAGRAWRRDRDGRPRPSALAALQLRL